MPGITTVPNSAYLAGNLTNNLAVTGNRNLGPILPAGRSSRTPSTTPRQQVIESRRAARPERFPGNIIPRAVSTRWQARFWPSSPSRISATSCSSITSPSRERFTSSSRFPRSRSIRTSATRSSCPATVERKAPTNRTAWTVCPKVLSRVRIQSIGAWRRVNYTISPTLLLHFSSGFISHRNPDTVPPVSCEYDKTTLGIAGSPATASRASTR